MTGISGQGVVFGIAMARREGVPEAATRAGLMMGLGGVSPIGAVLASNTIRAAKRARAAAGGKGATGSGGGKAGTLPSSGTGSSQTNQGAGQLTVSGPIATTKDVQAAVAPLKTQLEQNSAALTKAINDLATQEKVQVDTLNQSIQKLNETVERLVRVQAK